LTRTKRVLDQSGFSNRRPAEKGDWVPGNCQQRRGRTCVPPDSSDEESGYLANVATRNVLGCFSISICRFTLACSFCKRHLHELGEQPPLPLGGASIDFSRLVAAYGLCSSFLWLSEGSLDDVQAAFEEGLSHFVCKSAQTTP